MKKIASLIAGISLLATTLAPMSASAASATMSLTGATQTNGSFSTVVYENSDGPVSSVSLVMDFSTAVSGVAYDYSVGPFTTTDPSGGHLSQGSVSGQQAVARVTFTAPVGTTNASVNTSASYLKGASGTTIVRYTMSPASAAFTYNAPASTPTGGMGGGTSTGNTTTTTSGRSNAIAQNTTSTPAATDTATTATTDANKSDVKGDATATKDTKKSDNKNVVMAKDTAAKKHSVWPWIVLIIVAGIAAWYALRNRARAATAAENKEADAVVTPKADTSAKAKAEAAVAVASAKAAANKQRANANRKNTGKKPTRK